MNDNGFVGFNYMSDEELEENMERYREQMIELGIDYVEFDGTDTEYDKDVEMARDCIYSGREVPDNVRERLLERKNRLKVNEPRLLYRNIQDGRV